MKASLRLLAILGLSLSLSSCVGGPLPSSLVSSRQETSSLLSSSPAVSSSEAAVPSSSKAASSSSTKQEPSSSTAVHYTVSIYQSYYIEGKGEYGNPRFDTSVTREEGQFLFKDTKEEHDLRGICRPDYRGLGQIYFMFAFYKNEKCRERIIDGFAVDADLSIYYYCE